MEAVQMEGVQLIPAGAIATGVVRTSDPGGRVKGKASISIALKSIQLKDASLPIETNTLGATAKSTVKRDVVRGGIMTGAGAAIGAIVGGGKGAAIGAGAGGAAGAGKAMATRGDAAAFAAETPLSFTLKAPVTIPIQP
jgi:phage baseplate assembly protein gpV